MNEPLVEILMATYNGAAHLAAQIESILAQSHRNWKLIIHDDGSDDATVQIASVYVNRFAGQITLVDDGIRCGGARNNFAHLMALSSADYVCFCDQDDIWLDHKISESLQRLRLEEDMLALGTPLAVFTDLTVVDEGLNVVADSMWRFQRIMPELADSIDRLAVRNCITGCTMLLNRAAIDVCLPIPSYAVMHDWWCGLRILQARGKLLAIRTPSLLYRQHSGNVVGAKRWGLVSVMGKLLKGRSYWKGLRHNYIMAKHFLPGLGVGAFALRKLRALVLTTQH